MWRKWSYLIILFICGGLILTVTDSWSGAFEPARRMGILLASGVWQGAKGDTGAGENDGENGTGSGQLSGGDMQAADVPGGAAAGNDAQSDGSQGVNSQGVNSQGENSADGNSQGADSYGEGSPGEANQGDGVANEGPDVQNGQGEDPFGEEQPVWRDPSEVVYTAVEDSYFSDAVFIGDSRTVGMFEYGGLEEITTFYASTGLTVFKLFDSPIVEVPDQKDKITIEQALSERQFAKIYLMIGINEMGRGDLQGFLDKYSEVVEHLKELQPNAIIYLQAIMKVTDKRSSQGDYITNEGIEARNQGIAALADNVRVYYLDVNPQICTETGGMEPSYTTDGVHLKAQYIPVWKEFLKQHAVVLD